MKINAAFEKVSYDIYKQSFECSEDEIKASYNAIKLPCRATRGSAGYDFFTQTPIVVPKGGSVVIPTGIRCRMPEGWVLMLFPRSGLGFKFGLRLANTTGVIDQDYYYSYNEGHIMVKLINDSSIGKDVQLSPGSAFCQGVFLQYGVISDDRTDTIRNGGFGSSGRAPGGNSALV